MFGLLIIFYPKQLWQESFGSSFSSSF